MRVYKNPSKEEWTSLCERSQLPEADLSALVNRVFNEIRENGDTAVNKFTLEFDKIELKDLKVSTTEIEQANLSVSEDLKTAIKLAKGNIEKFHNAQKLAPELIETSPGVICWRESRPIQCVGIYIPGGTAPLFSTVLMLGIPAMLAGCEEIVLCSPPDKSGNIHPATLFTANLIGIKQIFKVGGTQAIGAMTFGTASIPKVDKIFGPGNQFVTAAKQQAMNYGVAIDMPAGPSEVLVIADRQSNPEFVAADLLSQAEHGVDSQVILLSHDERLIEETIKELKKQLEALPRKEIVKAALANSRAIVFNSLQTCFEFSNLYAPEHLILAIDEPKNWVHKVKVAGSVFLGNYSCESSGDYASGTNHTLPTNGFARNYSGVSLDSFVNKITFQELTSEGIQSLGPAIEVMAEAEGLDAHKNAVSVRLKSLKA